MCCKHYKEERAFTNSLIYASDPKPTPDEELQQFKNLCVCSVYTSAILNNSKRKGNKKNTVIYSVHWNPILPTLKKDFL